MASSYAARATTIHGLARDLRHKMELTSGVGTIADKLTVIETGVEIVNKVLHCFYVSQEMLDEIDTILNPYYKALVPDPGYINRLFYRLMSVVRRFEQYAMAWVERYRK